MWYYGKAEQREAQRLAPIIYGSLVDGIYTSVRVPLVLTIYLEKWYKDKLNIEYIEGCEDKLEYRVTLKDKQ